MQLMLGHPTYKLIVKDMSAMKKQLKVHKYFVCVYYIIVNFIIITHSLLF